MATMSWKYTIKIQRAIKFSIKTHDVYQKQKRKGKGTAYISHPLTVGLILSLAGARENLIVAGILHDTIEDSVTEKKVSAEMIAERFGAEVSELVMSVTETDKSMSWEERKKEALEHIRDFSHDSLLLKSADVLSNTSELIDDYMRNGEQIFEIFKAAKERVLKNYLETIGTILAQWPDNPLCNDLKAVAVELHRIGAEHFRASNPARLVSTKEFDPSKLVLCPVCGWHGTGEGNLEEHSGNYSLICPVCERMILAVA